MFLRLRQSVKIAAFLSVLLLGAVGSDFAQTQAQAQAPKPPVISVRSEIVLIPTVVTNNAGEHVSDLTQDDFTVSENGKPQKIVLFRHVKTSPELVKRPESPQNEFTNSLQTGSDRLTLFVLDLLNSTFTEQGTARNELIAFLRKSLNFEEPICLIAIDISGVRVLHDFTTDPAELSEALKNVTGHHCPKDEAPRDPDSFLLFIGHDESPHFPADRRIAAEENGLELLKLTTKAQELTDSQRAHLTLDALHGIAEAFSGIPGRKSLIWATAGMPVQIDGVTEVPRSQDPQLPVTFASHDRTLETVYESTWAALNRANIAVYPLDIEDLTNPAFVSPGLGVAPFKRSNLQSNISNLERFAEMTGGRLCDRRSDASGCFEKAAKDSTDYYILGYYKNGRDTKPGWRKLSVKVQKPAMRVQARAGYFNRGRLDEGVGRKEDLQLGLSSPLDFTGLPLTMKLTTVKESGKKKKIGFEYLLAPSVVTIDLGDSNHISLDFAAIATTSTGVPVGHFSETLVGNLTLETANMMNAKGAKVPGTIELPAGGYTVRFLVRDNLSGQMGSVSVPLTVP